MKAGGWRRGCYRELPKRHAKPRATSLPLPRRGREASPSGRQLSPTADGLPLEIYCFTNSTAWVAYEGIQSDIFDHLLAILPEFGLRVFQHPSGADMRELRNALGAAQD